jgi:hypothetical protein
MQHRLKTALIGCAVAALAMPAVAGADHRHVTQNGTGNCVVLSKQGNEPYVTLPDASYNDNSAVEPGSTNPHPLHVHVHQGKPGQVQSIAVLGSAGDPCAGSGNYLNWTP